MMNIAASQGQRTPAGFTLIELLLVVTLIGILSATAIPIVSRARGASLEVSTIGSLRTIHSAEATYASTCAQGSYAPSIAWLTRATKASGPPFLGPEFTANSIDRHGYRIRFTLGARVPTAKQTCNGLAAGQAVSSYFVGADPLVTGSSQVVNRFFGVNSGGVIYQSRLRVRSTLIGTPPAPAQPIQ